MLVEIAVEEAVRLKEAGKADEVVPVASVDKLVEKLSAQKNIEIDYRTVDKCDHYFSEHLEKLIGHVEDYLDKRLVEKAA